MTPLEQRPVLNSGLASSEFLRWYWTVKELVEFAGLIGVPAGGPKLELSARLAAYLDGNTVARTVKRRTAVPPLRDPLHAETVLPPGQRCSQQIRRWLVSQAGPSFTFTATVREHVGGSTDDRTLGSALRVWQSTHLQISDSIGSQFELNGFARAWSHAHVGASRADMMSAWAAHRELPIEARRAQLASWDGHP